MITGRVRVTREVQPRDGDALAEVRGGEEAVHDEFVGAWGFVGEEGIRLGESRRQAAERECDPAEQHFARGFGLELEFLGLELCGQEGVDGVGGRRNE